jgi:hypothetical protein
LIDINDQAFQGDFGEIIEISSNEYYLLVLPRIDFAELKKRGLKSSHSLLQVMSESYHPKSTYFDSQFLTIMNVKYSQEKLKFQKKIALQFTNGTRKCFWDVSIINIRKESNQFY